MNEKDSFERFPETIRAGTTPGSVDYTRVPGQFAVFGPVPTPLQKHVIATIGSNEISIFRGSPYNYSRQIEKLDVVPVYSSGPGAPPAVPGGKVYIRFGRDVSAEEQRESVAKAGYDILEVPDYAPHTAWVAATTGGMVATLSQIRRLEELAGIENVEPQMLKPAARKRRL